WIVKLFLIRNTSRLSQEMYRLHTLLRSFCRRPLGLSRRRRLRRACRSLRIGMWRIMGWSSNVLYYGMLLRNDSSSSFCSNNGSAYIVCFIICILTEKYQKLLYIIMTYIDFILDYVYIYF